MSASFIHLNVHTHYSIVDGLASIDDLLKTAQSMGMSSLAITDQSNLFALVKFYRAALRYGIKPIIGADVWVKNTTSTHTQQLARMTLLCQNQTGYQNLSRLISRAYQEGQHDNDKPHITDVWLTTESTDGLIALSGGQEGDINTSLLANKPTRAEAQLAQWLAVFGDRFYLSIQRLGQADEDVHNDKLLAFAEKHQTPVVATNAVRFLKSEDFTAHEARVCIYEGCTLEERQNKTPYTAQQYLRSPDEMAALFADIPEVLDNSVEIAKRCNFELTLGKYFLPNFPLPDNVALPTYFKETARAGLTRLFDEALSPVKADIERYKTRLDMELEVIESMGFAAYFLIVADFIQWAKAQKIPVGPGRGSGPGSLVAYALGITTIDPIAHGLLFERFLNPARVSMPDFDIDFCVNGRDRVIDYVAEKFGRESVAQIITHGTMAAKAVVRDTGRVLGYPYGYVDKLAKLIPFEIGMTLRKALQQEPQLNQLFQDEDDVNTLIKLALPLEGKARNVGKHAGGLVVAPSHLTDFTPLYCEPDGTGLITQLDKDDIETIGLVKFDFLGLRTLTIIDATVQQINALRKATGKPEFTINTLGLDDEKTFELLRSGVTEAIFQIESYGMKDLVKRLQPNHFNDIVALVALYRPGPLQSGMVDDYIDRRHGRAPVTYPHKLLEPILKTTYGVILYQEQVMQIAQTLAGYSLGDADLLRRAMGKKKPEEMAKHRAIFTEGAAKKGISAELAGSIFDLMEKFAGYGFNKSHSVAYAILTYQTAWLKAHYPANFMAAVLSSDMDNTDKIVGFVEGCRKLNLTINQPAINSGAYKFTVNSDGHINYGLGAIKGVGEGAIKNIITAREAGGPFQNLADFCTRVDSFRVNKRTLEALIMSGAFDCFAKPRAVLLASLNHALSLAEQTAKAKAQGQHDLFASLDEPSSLSDHRHFTYEEKTPPWTEQERLKREKSVLGIYLSGHPITSFATELTQMGTIPLSAIKPNNESILIAGYVLAIRTKFTRKGQKIAFVTLDDAQTRIDLSVFADAYSQYHTLLAKDQLLIVKGEASIDEFTGKYKVSAEHIYDLTQARNLYARKLLLTVSSTALSTDFTQRLKSILQPFKGGQCPLLIRYQGADASGDIALGKAWRVNITDALIDELSQLCGEAAVSIAYR